MIEYNIHIISIFLIPAICLIVSLSYHYYLGLFKNNTNYRLLLGKIES